MTHTPTPRPPVDRTGRRSNQLSWLYRILGVASVALFLVTGTLAILQTQRVENLRAAYASQRADAEEAAKTAAAEYGAQADQYAKLFAACQKSVECLASAPPQQAPIIIQGAPGSPGRSVTAADIEAALESYCSAHNECIGTTGASGAVGQNGADGAPGATGAAGATGATGATGVGVASITCALEPDGVTTAFRFVLTDGSTIDVAGMCTPPIPAPLPLTPAP